MSLSMEQVIAAMRDGGDEALAGADIPSVAERAAAQARVRELAERVHKVAGDRCPGVFKVPLPDYEQGHLVMMPRLPHGRSDSERYLWGKLLERRGVTVPAGAGGPELTDDRLGSIFDSAVAVQVLECRLPPGTRELAEGRSVEPIMLAYSGRFPRGAPDGLRRIADGLPLMPETAGMLRGEADRLADLVERTAPMNARLAAIAAAVNGLFVHLSREGFVASLTVGQSSGGPAETIAEARRHTEADLHDGELLYLVDSVQPALLIPAGRLGDLRVTVSGETGGLTDETRERLDALGPSSPLNGVSFETDPVDKVAAAIAKVLADNRKVRPPAGWDTAGLDGIAPAFRGVVEAAIRRREQADGLWDRRKARAEVIIEGLAPIQALFKQLQDADVHVRGSVLCLERSVSFRGGKMDVWMRAAANAPMTSDGETLFQVFGHVNLTTGTTNCHFHTGRLVRGAIPPETVDAIPASLTFDPLSPGDVERVRQLITAAVASARGLFSIPSGATQEPDGGIRSTEMTM